MFKFFEKRAFKKEFNRAVRDGFLDEEEKRQLESYKVDRSFADSVRTKHFLKISKPLRDKISTTMRMSPQQEEELNKIAHGLGIDMNQDQSFLMARELWASDHGEEVFIQPVDVNIILKPREQCFLRADAQWLQKKAVHQRVGYSGFSKSVHIAKGLNYRIGTVRPRYRDTIETKSIVVGHIYITDQRIIFEGEGKSTNITFNRLIEVKPYGDGIELVKTSGQDDFFHMAPLQGEYAILVVHSITSSQRTRN